MKREKFLSWMSEEKEPIPFRENGRPRIHRVNITVRSRWESTGARWWIPKSIFRRCSCDPKKRELQTRATRRLIRLEIQARNPVSSRVITIGMEKIRKEIEQCRYRYELRQEVQKSTDVSRKVSIWQCVGDALVQQVRCGSGRINHDKGFCQSPVCL